MIDYENLGKANESFYDEFQHSFAETLKSGWFVLGNNVKSFEAEFAAYCGSEYCCGVASGLDALILSVKALDFKKGSEIIVPSNTYIATIISIIQAGHTPILVEPDIESYNLDPRLIEEKITPNTRAVMLVHLYGKSCQMDAIMDVAAKHDLKVIEDCAQSHGAMYKNKKTGTWGDAGAFSFYPTKNLGALGDCGGVTSDDEQIINTVRKLRNYGSNEKYHNDIIGANSRLDEIQAGFLSIKLKKLDEITSHKRQLANIYLENLKDDFIKPIVDENYFDVYHIFNIRHPNRDELKGHLSKNEINTEIHYPIAPNKQKALQDMLGHLDFPISEEIHNTTLSLPISYFHTKNDIHKVIEVMNRF